MPEPPVPPPFLAGGSESSRRLPMQSFLPMRAAGVFTSSRRRRPRSRLSLCAALLAVAAASAGCGDSRANAEAAGADGAPKGGRDRVAPVETALVDSGTISRAVTVSGAVEPIRTVGVNTQLPGALLSIHAEEGMLVRAGQVLARIDDRELAAQVARAQAELEEAKAAFERARQLRDRELIPEGEYEVARTALASSESELEQLHARRSYATVRAPIAGVVLEKQVEAGDVVGSQTRLFTLGDISTRVVRVALSELDVVELEAGAPVSVALDAYPGREILGRIRRIFPAADPASRLVPVEVALLGPQAELARPGFLARATFALGAREGALLVPASTIVSGTGAAAVFVVQDGRANRRTVETGLSSRGQIEILSGVSAGDTVVVAGNNALRDGARVRVVAGPGAKPEDSAAAAEVGE